MVNAKTAGIPLIALTVSFALIVTIGGVDLSGSQAKNLYCEIPFLSDSDRCQTISEDQDYKTTFDITVGRLDVKQMDVTTETTDKDHLSALTSDLSTLAFPAETTDAKLEMVLRDSEGRVVASDTKRFGTIVGDETRETSFVADNIESGTYELYLEYTGNGCGLLSCSEIFETTDVEVEIPTLPLNEKKNFNLVVT